MPSVWKWTMRLRNENRDWRPRSETREHVIRGTSEPHDAHVHAAFYPLDERLFKEVGEPWPRDCAALHALQLLRVHKTLRVTPAMEAGLTDHVWTLDELIGLLKVTK